MLIDDFYEQTFMINNIVAISEKSLYEQTLNKIELKKVEPNFQPISKRHIQRKVKEIDLHFDELSESKRGMTNHDIVLYQLKVVKKTIRNIDRRYFNKIVFIHGIGKGKLRYELEYFLKSNKIRFQDASFKKYGRGAVEIIL